MSEIRLSIRDLVVDYITPEGPARAIDRVSLDLAAGELLGVAGESGCGKSTLAKAILRILPPPAVIRRGQIHLGDTDILAAEEDALQSIRWSRIGMVFQSAMNALNPVLTIGEQFRDCFAAHKGPEGDDADRRTAELMEMVGIPRQAIKQYSHQLSGGMRQRVGIALGLALEPELLILDEPTTALDVVLEQEILGEIRQLQRELGFSAIFITHDLERMLEICDRVAIFYAGQIVESGPSAQLMESAAHPYTQGLLRAYPSLHRDPALCQSIPGSPPNLLRPPKGCRFAERCQHAFERCTLEEPKKRVHEGQQLVACHLNDEWPWQ